MEWTTFKRFLKGNRGAAAVVEAALVYPLVILAVAAAVYAAVFMYETAVLESMAAEAASLAAQNISFSGYDELTGDGLSDDDIPVSAVKAAYSDRKPYRYFIHGDVSLRENENILMGTVSGVMPAYDGKCSLEVHRRLTGYEVRVTAEKNIRLPQVFRIMNIDTSRSMKVTASALTADPAEFLRNTDTAFEAYEFLDERYGLSEKKDAAADRIKDALRSFGVLKDEEN